MRKCADSEHTSLDLELPLQRLVVQDLGRRLARERHNRELLQLGQLLLVQLRVLLLVLRVVAVRAIRKQLQRVEPLALRRALQRFGVDMPEELAERKDGRRAQDLFQQSCRRLAF